MGRMVAAFGVLAVIAASCGGPAEPERIYEDDPRWDCRTMGNRGCGVQDSSGAWLVVVHDAAGYPTHVVTRQEWQQQLFPELG